MLLLLLSLLLLGKDERGESGSLFEVVDLWDFPVEAIRLGSDKVVR